MNTLHKDLLQEHHDVDAKLLNRFLTIFKKPDVPYDKSFKASLDRKLSKKIQEKQETADNQLLSMIPSFAKWRFRMTGFVAAMCVFLFVFILSFFSDFFGDALEIPQKYSYVGQESFSAVYPMEMEAVGEADVAREEVAARSPALENAVASSAMFDLSSKVLRDEVSQELYRLLYDGKKYPKISALLPVYKR